MAFEPLASKGNVLHIDDFAEGGKAEEFTPLFEELELGRDIQCGSFAGEGWRVVPPLGGCEPLYQIGEWKSIEEHQRILKVVARCSEVDRYGRRRTGGIKPTYEDVS